MSQDLEVKVTVPVTAVVLTAVFPDGTEHSFSIRQSTEEFSPDDQFAPVADQSGSPQTRPADVETVALFDGDGPIRNLVIAAIARQTGRSRKEVSAKVDEAVADSGRPLIDWITSGGLLAFIQAIVALFGFVK